jgi:hypothetical protein
MKSKKHCKHWIKTRFVIAFFAVGAVRCRKRHFALWVVNLVVRNVRDMTFWCPLMNMILGVRGKVNAKFSYRAVIRTAKNYAADDAAERGSPENMAFVERRKESIRGTAP